MSINTIIEEQTQYKRECEHGEMMHWKDCPECREFMVRAGFSPAIIQILEAEVERLKGMKKEDDGMEYIIVMNTHNQCIDVQITHLTNIIKEIC